MADAESNSLNSSTLAAPQSEWIMSSALLGVLVVLLVPLPTQIVDLLLAFNIVFTMLVLLTTLSARQPLDFSVFPSMLLLMTLFRLALNVATTRLILLRGNSGLIVDTFGRFVIEGNVVVGLVIFLILVIIQFVVITKGAGRVSEVSARFTLDALPGKQMAIDAELNSHAIDEEQAKARRRELLRETEFYGSMDGASKFVRGDAIAGLIITAINLVGGIIIGLSNGLMFSESIQKYSVLTVGDGLVSQIPALIVATASGILVTKTTSETSLGQEIGAQFTAQPRTLIIGGVIMGILGVAPGMPFVPFVILAAGLIVIGRRLQNQPSETASKTPAAEAVPSSKTPLEIPLDEFLETDRAGVEIGGRLIPWMNPKMPHNLIDRIGGLRRDLAKKNGFWVPPIRVRDDIHLEPDAYRVLVAGREVARGRLQPDKWLAIAHGSAPLPIEGEATTEPAFQLPAKWIEETDRRRAEMGGHTVVDALNVLITHLGEMLRRYAHELLSREDLKMLVDRVRESSPSVVDELIPNNLSMGALHRVLYLLLQERVPITNLTRILESLANHAPTNKDPAELTEQVRADIGRSLCDRYRDEQGRMYVILFDPLLDQEMRRPDGTFFRDPQRLEQFASRVVDAWKQAMAQGRDAPLMCDSSLRRTLRQTFRSHPDLAVIAFQEAPSDFVTIPHTIVRFEDVAKVNAQ